MKPLREAARDLGLSEEAVRRKILLGEIAAAPVDDDRQYLVDVPAPATRRPCCGRLRVVLWSLAAWAVLGAAMTLGTARSAETCGVCGSIRVTERLWGVPMNQETIHVAGLDCRHDWDAP
jgi:hypothetical protein